MSSLDDTWQKCDNSSRTGVVSILSIYIGEVLDYIADHLQCHKCSACNKRNKKSDKYKTGEMTIRLLVTLIIADLLIAWKYKVPFNFFYALLAKIVYDTQYLWVMEIQIIMLQYLKPLKRLHQVIVVTFRKTNVLVIFRKELELHLVNIKRKTK